MARSVGSLSTLEAPKQPATFLLEDGGARVALRNHRLVLGRPRPIARVTGAHFSIDPDEPAPARTRRAIVADCSPVQRLAV